MGQGKEQVLTMGKNNSKQYKYMSRKGPNHRSVRTDISFVNTVTCEDRVEIWGVKGGWKETEKDHEMFCKRIFGIPRTAVNGACVRKLGRINGREKVLEKIIKYWKRLWEMEETSLLSEALKQQNTEKGENWLKRRTGAKQTRYGRYVKKGRGE
jgi:hypothetical protein